MSGETILIVDDEESVRKSLAGVMRDEGYEVVADA
jgi:CheY-like chemotaxis protein